jgi:L1 cell adhesion molecule like protein
MTEFSECKSDILWHIPHKYSTEMKAKSTIVPLGIELKNETKIDEMCSIMDSLHKYVPSIPIKKDVTLPNGELFNLCDEDLWETLFGGDQLTVARARGAIGVRADHDSATDKLKGLTPVIDDWHCRMTLLKVA